MVRILLIVFAALPMAAFAAQLRGRVVDGVTKEPLARAQMRLEARTIAAITDSAGRFVIDNLSPGTYSLKTIIIGYLPLTEPVIVRNAGTEVELTMPPAAKNLRMLQPGQTETIRPSPCRCRELNCATFRQ